MRYIDSPEAAEVNAALRMRDLGFVDAQVSGPGADGGIDVFSERAVAQVKYRVGFVGRPDLQRLFGARGNRSDLQMLFFAGSGYSRQAVEYADKVGMALFVYDEIGIVAPHNGCAENLVNRAGRPVRVTDDPGEPDFYPDVDIAVAVELARSYRAEQHEIRVAEHLATREPVPPLIPVDVKSAGTAGRRTETSNAVSSSGVGGLVLALLGALIAVVSFAFLAGGVGAALNGDMTASGRVFSAVAAFVVAALLCFLSYRMIRRGVC